MAESGSWAGDVIKGIFMPHTNLEKIGKRERDAAAKQEAILKELKAQNEQDEIKAKKQQKNIYIAIGAIVVVGLGVGLYFAFKK